MFSVEVHDYNPEWPKHFKAIKRELERILRGVSYKTIEHVGSTSVVGLAAKPIIDIDIVTTEGSYREVLATIDADGTYENIGQMGITDRYAIRLLDETVLPKRNIYVCIDGCQALRNHLAIRDTCRANSALRDRYRERKLELSTWQWEDKNVNGYCKAKTGVLISILSEAGFGEDELKQIAAMNGCISK